MGNGSLSSSNNQNKTNNDTPINESNHHLLELDFQYIDQKQTLKIENRIRFSPKDTIRTLAKDFLELDEQRVISPDKVVLMSICLSGQCSPAPAHTARTTLHELNIKNKSLLCFEPLSARDRPKLSALTLFSPYDNAKKIGYEWNEKSTNLNMLLEDVIKIFHFNSIKRENIQLCTFLNENLNRSNNLEKKLSELGLRSYHSVFVTIINSTSYDKYDQDICVRVESSSFGEIFMHASHTNTIMELKNQIARRFSHTPYIDIHLSDAEYKTLEKSSSKRSLGELGINSGETINAIVREDPRNKQTITMNQTTDKSQLSPSATNSHKVFVQCVFSNHEPITIQVSLTDTVAQVKLKLATLRKNQSTTEFYLSSESIDIESKPPDRCLADLGVKSGSTIYATMLDNDTSLRSSRNYSNYSMPLGLINLGNTCFMNSALQCLIHIVPLTQFFLDGFTQDRIGDDSHHDWNSFDTCGKVTGAYAELIRNIRGPNRQNSNVNSFRPIRMKEIIGYIAPHFATSDQQDAQEFIIFLLDAIHNELLERNRPDRNTIIQQLFFGTINSRITCLSCYHVKITTNRISVLPLPLKRQERMFTVNFLGKNDTNYCSVVDVPIGGRIECLVQTFLQLHSLSQLRNYIVVITTNTGKQLDFEMPLKRLSEHEVTLIEQEEYINRIQPNQFDMEPDNLKLEECLQEFISLEQLDDLWFCQQDTCQRNTQANKQLQFKSLPRVLIIQLKRFSYRDGYRRKLDTFVDYPINGLNLNKLISSAERETIYDLIAMSNHIGSISSGHYITYARQGSKKDEWYKFDDSYVSSINSSHEIVSKNAYLLFYIKRNK